MQYPYESQMMNVGPAKTPFADREYEGDDRLRSFIESQGIVKPREVLGSTFYKIPDDTQPGGFRYEARRKDNVENIGRGNRMTEMGKNGVTQDKTYTRPITNKIAAQAEPEFRSFVEQSKSDERASKAKADALAESNRASAQRIAEATALFNLQRGAKKEDIDLARQDPMYQMQMEDLKRTRAEAAQKKQEREAAINNIRAGYDVPGISKSGERSYADALESGMDMGQALIAGRAQHAKDEDRIRSLEERGTPEDIAEANAMRASDPDLRNVRSFLRAGISDTKARDIASSVSDVAEPFAQKYVDKNAAEKIADFFGMYRSADVADIPREIMEPIQARFDEAINGPHGMDPNIVRAQIKRNLIKRGIPRSVAEAMVGE